jgi:flagellar biosynthesis activator protein FlaF
MSSAAQAYTRTSQTTAAPREIEAQALLKAARQLQDVATNWAGPDKNMHQALLFNRRLWSIFMSAVETNDNPQPMEIRQNIANIGVFVMKQTVDMQLNADRHQLQSRGGPVGPRLMLAASGGISWLTL